MRRDCVHNIVCKVTPNQSFRRIPKRHRAIKDELSEQFVLYVSEALEIIIDTTYFAILNLC